MTEKPFRTLKSALYTSLAFVLVACGAAPAHEAPHAPADAAYPQPAPMGAPPSAEAAALDAAVGGDGESEDAPAPASAPAMKSAGTPSPTGAKPKTAESAYTVPSSGVKAGEWDDNANYREFMKYLGTTPLSAPFRSDVSKRRFLVVRDKQGKGVPNCEVLIHDAQQKAASLALTTTASGRALFFPKAEGFAGTLMASTKCQGGRASAQFDVSADDGVVELTLDKQRVLPTDKTIDIAFVLDTTGSMSEEIGAVKTTIRKVSAELTKLNVDVRIGLVEYRDVTDKFTTRVYPMTSNISDFAREVDALKAGGGGDTPEHMNEGLRVAVSQLAWSDQSVARIAFVISDAPPHLDYANDTPYTTTMKQANRAGIQLFTIAASGMDATGQAVLRQIAQYTGGTNMFVLRGGAGTQSVGGGDPTSSCGGTHKNFSSGNLDALITDKIKLTLKSLELDPMLIAGLHKDELAKPCKERLVIAH